MLQAASRGRLILARSCPKHNITHASTYVIRCIQQPPNAPIFSSASEEAAQSVQDIHDSKANAARELWFSDAVATFSYDSFVTLLRGRITKHGNPNLISSPWSAAQELRLLCACCAWVALISASRCAVRLRKVRKVTSRPTANRCALLVQMLRWEEWDMGNRWEGQGERLKWRQCYVAFFVFNNANNVWFTEITNYAYEQYLNRARRFVNLLSAYYAC